MRVVVIDVDGAEVGRVVDALLVHDGPKKGDFGPQPRVEGVAVGRGSVGVRLGYHRVGVQGPAPIDRFLEWLDRRARFVPWSEVASLDAGVIRLKCKMTELGEPPRI